MPLKKELKPGDSLHGFTVTAVDDLAEYHGKGIRLRHEITGMDVYHVQNDDPENLFAFGFKTPPEDHTGVAHILEHTVLSGSKQYPVKDPFLALMRGSVNTFLNAMTYPDKTVYPAATTVKRDYYNLMAVYGDAVFFPLLKRELFLQEGRRFVPGEDGKISVEGIVFNEMKGNYSSFESLVGDWSYRSLFESSHYRYDSGGDPAHIPFLTYENFLQFHKTYYHPANCRLFLYGDIPTEEQLEFLQEKFLRTFSEGQSAPEIEHEPRWDEARSLEVKGPTSDGEEGDGHAKPETTINWITGDSSDPLTLLSLQVLSGILIGHAGTPLQKLIDDTELGEDMSSSSGLESDLRDITFTVGIRGIAPEKSAEFEQLVLKELRRLSEEGLPRDLIEGTLKRVEFRNREIKGGAPFGLRLMGKVMKGWMHGSEPKASIEFTPHMEELKRRYAEDPAYFEGLIKTYFLDNPHRSRVTVIPDKRYLEDLEQSVAQAVDELANSSPELARDRIREDLEAFVKFQNTADSQEAIDSIPILSREDLPEDISIIETEEGELNGIPFYSHELFTNGIAYIDFGFNLSGLTRRERMLLTLLSRLSISPGLPGMEYDEVSRQLNMRTGGFYPHLEVSPVAGNADGFMSFLFYRLKVLPDVLSDALDLVTRIMLEAKLQDEKRLFDVLTELRNDMRSAIIPAGHTFSVQRAGAHLSPSLRIGEEMRGIEQLLFLSALPHERGEELLQLGLELERLRDKIITQDRLLLNISGEEEELGRLRSALASSVERIPDGSKRAGSMAKSLFSTSDGEDLSPLKNRWESLQIPAAVGYTGMALPSKLYGDPDYSSHILVAHLLKTDYLWQKIRMQGGAYGAAASVNGLEGVFSFLSYRDPHVESSLKVYTEALEHLSREEVSADDLEKAIIALVGKDTRPKSPGEKSVVGLKRKLYGIDDDLRRRVRHGILESSPETIRAAAAQLHAELERSVRIVMAGKDKLDLAEKDFQSAGMKRLVIPM